MSAGAASISALLPDAAGDVRLVQRIRARDEHALRELYERYATPILSLAMRVLGDNALAQEVVQDVFWRCWSEAAQYDPQRGRVGTWLFTLARNRAIDLSRQRGRRSALVGELDDAQATRVSHDPQHGERVIVSEWIAGALAALPAREREALELAYFQGLSQTDIATALETPLGTIKTRMRSGLERLRGLLSPTSTRATPEVRRG